MLTKIQFKGRQVEVDLSQPIDISIPLRSGNQNPSAWYVAPPQIKPVVMDQFVGSVAKGASTNFNNIVFNPHAHGTHTECIGHITEEFYSVNECLKQFYFMAALISVQPVRHQEDFVITEDQLELALKEKEVTALIIRTLPNEDSKVRRPYAHTNPAYLTKEAAEMLRLRGIEHLLVDLPSVDKEKDGGQLAAHKAFWDFDGERRLDATITEFIFVPNHVPDGAYLLNLQIASFENDASPSKPVLYQLINQ